MNSVHLLIPDLFLPKEIASQAVNGLYLPALEKLLARGFWAGASAATNRAGAGQCLENYLCEIFGVAGDSAADAPVAVISAGFDRLGDGSWLRADPVHLHLDQSQMLLSTVSISGDEASALCASMNEYFIGQGISFFAPHPQRWYVLTDTPPRIRTVPLSQVIGVDVRNALPAGEDATRWHGVLTEVQMLLNSHTVNNVREMRDELPVNSVWLWGGGSTGNISPRKIYDCVSSDEVVSAMFAAATGARFAAWAVQWQDEGLAQLLVWTGLRDALQRGDLAAWRIALQDFETGYAQPIWQALCAGRIENLKIDILGGENVRKVHLLRSNTWNFWRRAKPLEYYSMV